MKSIQTLFKSWEENITELEKFFSLENEDKMMNLQIKNRIVISKISEKRQALTNTLLDGLDHAEQCFKDN